MVYVPPFVPKVDLPTFYNMVMPKERPAAAHHIPIMQALEDFRIPNLMIISGPGNGKSTVTSLVYPAWLLGHDPKHTILGISAGEALPQGFMMSTGGIINSSPAFRRVFPSVIPDRRAGWSREAGIYVTGRTYGDPDASYLGVGIASKALTGKHAKTIIMDDLHDRENSVTDEGCKKIIATYYDTIMGRGDPQGCRKLLSGRRFSVGDIYGFLRNSGDWVVMELPAERPSNTMLWWDVYVPKDKHGNPLDCFFSQELSPEKKQVKGDRFIKYKLYYGEDPTNDGFYWPKNDSKRSEYFTVKRNMPAVAESTYQCNPGARANAIFVESDFCFDHPLNADQLRGARYNETVQRVIDDCGGLVVQAWDTAFGESSGSAYSVCVTALLQPSRAWWRNEDLSIFGEPDRHNRVHVLDVYREKVAFPDLNKQVRIQYQRWVPRWVLIEDRASGISLLQNLRTTHIPVKGIRVKEGKMSRAMDAVGGGTGSVQGWMRQHRVTFPRMAPWVPKLMTELLDFNGQKNGGEMDQVDALVHLISYAIEQGVGQVRLPLWDESAMFASVQAIESGAALDPRYQALQGISMLDGLHNPSPIGDTCSTCLNWDGRPTTSTGALRNQVNPFCRMHKRNVTALDTCYDYEAPNRGPSPYFVSARG